MTFTIDVFIFLFSFFYYKHCCYEKFDLSFCMWENFSKLYTQKYNRVCMCLAYLDVAELCFKCLVPA